MVDANDWVDLMLLDLHFEVYHSSYMFIFFRL